MYAFSFTKQLFYQCILKVIHFIQYRPNFRLVLTVPEKHFNIKKLRFAERNYVCTNHFSCSFAGMHVFVDTIFPYLRIEPKLKLLLSSQYWSSLSSVQRCKQECVLMRKSAPALLLLLKHVLFLFKCMPILNVWTFLCFSLSNTYTSIAFKLFIFLWSQIIFIILLCVTITIFFGLQITWIFMYPYLAYLRSK